MTNIQKANKTLLRLSPQTHLAGAMMLSRLDECKEGKGGKGGWGTMRFRNMLVIAWKMLGGVMENSDELFGDNFNTKCIHSSCELHSV
jgi:hypothetical protein